MPAQVHILTAEEVGEFIPKLSFAEVLRDSFAGLALGRAVQPAQTLMPLSGGGDVIIYAATIEGHDVAAVTISPYLPKRTPPVTAWSLLFSIATGEPLLLCDSLALTVERTAATTSLAVDLLAPQSVERLGVIGSGQVACAHLRHIVPLRQFKHIGVYSPGLAGSPTARNRVHDASPTARFCRSAEEAATGVDVLLLCTSAAEPVVDIDWLTNSALVTSISTDSPGAHEIAPSALPRLAVYCDYRQAAPFIATEMLLAAESGWAPDDIIADLPELIAGLAPKRPPGRAFFRSVGLGIEDTAVAVVLYQALIDRKS